MNKEMSVYHVVVCAVFIGLLLTFSIFYLVGMAVDGESMLESACYDGTVIEGEDPVSRFECAFYQNASSLAFVQEFQYRLFGVVNHHLVIAGDKDFLFEMADAETGYNYIEDYTGNFCFTEEEMAAIHTELVRRQAGYAARDCEYYLVVLPNSQTMYSEYMPAYYGGISNRTRFAVLERYLIDHGFNGVININDELKAAKSDGLLYNNTENSLNALGLYHTYRAVCGCFSDSVMENIHPLERDTLEFHHYQTAGKSIAQQAGLEDVVENHTVSLSGTTHLNYRFVNNHKAATTIKLPFYVASEASGSPELLLQFSNAWERLQIEPYFSNTFSKVTYQVGFEDDADIFAAADPKVVFQFIYENELSALLPDGAP